MSWSKGTEIIWSLFFYPCGIMSEINIKRYLKIIILVQDGRVEGCALISSCKSTKITTSCWTAIDRRTLEPTKKRYHTSKDKLQWYGNHCRGAIMIQSNPTPTGWVTHKLENNDINEVLPLLWRFWAPHQRSQAGDLEKRLGIPREYDFEGQCNLIIGFPQD